MDTGILRIIDANFNRAREGLRVVEELVRFELNDQGLSERLKRIRHSVADLIDETFDSSLFISARDSQGDVGLAIRVDTEGYRKGVSGIIEANMKRAQEAMRVLEEFTKLCHVEVQKHGWKAQRQGDEKAEGYEGTIPNSQHIEETSQKIKVLRYQVYSLEQEVLQRVVSLKRIRGLYFILDYGLLGEKIWDRDYIREMIATGVSVVQLRVKNMPDGKLILLSNMLREITEAAGIPLIINDRIDIALAVSADGVHLGQDDMPINIARKLIGKRIIGISTHNIAQAQQAEKDGADYIGIGAVYATTTKHDVGSPIGCEMVSEICKNVSLPIVAIGGINQNNIAEVLKTGVNGIAVANAILKTDDPVAATKKMTEMLAE